MFLVPPVIVNSPGEMTVAALSSVTLTCDAQGDPAPVVTWTKEGHYIASSDRVTLINNGSLVSNQDTINSKLYREILFICFSMQY